MMQNCININYFTKFSQGGWSKPPPFLLVPYPPESLAHNSDMIDLILDILLISALKMTINKNDSSQVKNISPNFYFFY